jgi:surface carbohydrate biosynthesis protein (TIGR04326 family)
MVHAVIWFGKCSATSQDEIDIRWQEYLPANALPERQYSLPQLVHDNTDVWKSEYLRWLNEIQSSRIGDKTLEQSMSIRPGLSYWWMTIPTNFSLTPASVAYRTVRLWALAELAEQLNISSLELIAPERDLETALLHWAQNVGISVTVSRVRKPLSRWSSPADVLRSSGRSSALLLMAAWAAASYGVRYRGRKPLEGAGAGEMENDLTIVDYFASFNVDLDLKARYASSYWGGLPTLLAERGMRVNWLHIDYRGRSAPSVEEARRAIAELNDNHAGQTHSLIQDQLTFGALKCAVRDYLRIAKVGRRLCRENPRWIHDSSRMDMWPVLAENLRRVFYGPDAIQNAIWMNLFERSAVTGSRGKTCLYLMENQPWELAMIAAWRTDVPSIIGVQHAAVRVWDTRYALGSTGDASYRHPELPQPDRVLVNGPMARSIMEANGRGTRELVDVEALRYIASSPKSRSSPPTRDGDSRAIEILAMGEYDSSLSEMIVEGINRLAVTQDGRVNIRYRPHPAAAPARPNLHPGILLGSAAEIHRELARSDLVLCSSMSSVSLEAFLAGVPTIEYCDGRVLNGQLLPKEAAWASVMDIDSLLLAVDDFIDGREATPIGVLEFFNLDSALPHWQEILDNL